MKKRFVEEKIAGLKSAWASAKDAAWAYNHAAKTRRDDIE